MKLTLWQTENYEPLQQIFVIEGNVVLRKGNSRARQFFHNLNIFSITTLCSFSTIKNYVRLSTEKDSSNSQISAQSQNHFMSKTLWHHETPLSRNVHIYIKFPNVREIHTFIHLLIQFLTVIHCKQRIIIASITYFLWYFGRNVFRI